jgi:hypothetical protein
MLTWQTTASLDDRRMWGRTLQSYKGGCGTGRVDDEPEHDGSLWGGIPLMNGSQTKNVWRVLGIDTEHPESVWHRIDQFDTYLLLLDGLKFSRLLSSKFWVCRLSFYFDLEHSTAQSSVEVPGVRFFAGQTIPDLFITIDALLISERAPPPLPSFAQNLLWWR